MRTMRHMMEYVKRYARAPHSTKLEGFAGQVRPKEDSISLEADGISPDGSDKVNVA
ncbi:hypothetical protein C1H46_042910 [Malus baccata]|uniref:Uncharacterized protein n=1 Tax=Malus baccata TaxID=106549 RepID=A0A540KBG0_MALBA|nr:hypothetical protein C1H46_042910 [Malus baccata]